MRFCVYRYSGGVRWVGCTPGGGGGGAWVCMCVCMCAGRHSTASVSADCQAELKTFLPSLSL